MKNAIFQNITIDEIIENSKLLKEYQSFEINGLPQEVKEAEWRGGFENEGSYVYFRIDTREFSIRRPALSDMPNTIIFRKIPGFAKTDCCTVEK